MLQARRIGLRAIEEGDLVELLRWRNDPRMRRFFRESRELSSSHQHAWFEDVSRRGSTVRMHAIFDLESLALLGACGLCYLDWVSRSADLSIYIGADNVYIDEVFAPDAARVLIDYGFSVLGLHRLWAEVYDYDERKKSLFADLGFQVDGRLREHHWDGTGWHDSLIFGLLQPEWTMHDG